MRRIHVCMTSLNEYHNKNLKRTVEALEADIAEKLQKTSQFANYFAKRDRFSYRPTLSLVEKFTETSHGRSAAAMSSSAVSAISTIPLSNKMLSCVTRVANFQKMKFGTRCQRRLDRDAVGDAVGVEGSGESLPAIPLSAH